jgi:hypothetical protein
MVRAVSKPDITDAQLDQAMRNYATLAELRVKNTWSWILKVAEALDEQGALDGGQVRELRIRGTYAEYSNR